MSTGHFGAHTSTSYLSVCVYLLTCCDPTTLTVTMCKFGNFPISKRFRYTTKFIHKNKEHGTRCVYTFRRLNCCLSCALFVSRCHFHKYSVIYYTICLCSKLRVYSAYSGSYMSIVLLLLLLPHCTSRYRSIWIDRKFDLLHLSSDKTIFNLYTPCERQPIDEWWHPMPMNGIRMKMVSVRKSSKEKMSFFVKKTKHSSKKNPREKTKHSESEQYWRRARTTTMFYFNHYILTALMVRQNLSSPDKRMLCSLSVWHRRDAFVLFFFSFHLCA